MNWSPMYWRTAFFAAFVVAIACGFFFLGNRIFTNTTAIEKACILIDNKLTENQNQAANPDSRQSILVSSIIRNMTSEEFRRFQQAESLVPENIDCKEAAHDPKNIKATPHVTTTTPPPKGP